VSRGTPEAAGRLPAAILMSGIGSNARQLLELPAPAFEVRLILTDNPASNAAAIAREHGVECAVLDIRAFCDAQGDPARLHDSARRAAYDRKVGRRLARSGARLAALAGWDWIVGPELCRSFLFVNVHPGDLRVTDGQGRRKYVGLGWIPTAKAILAGERFVHSCTHLVTTELDGGPIARISRPVPVDLPPGVTPANLLPEGLGLGDLIRDIRYNEGSRHGEALLYTHSRMLQERLKEQGDWVEFPRTVQRLAELALAGRLVLDASGSARLDGEPPGELFLMRE
jgi:folate-dependent phosphoribosylglycinamide formyltransferase PurN